MRKEAVRNGDSTQEAPLRRIPSNTTSSRTLTRVTPFSHMGDNFLHSIIRHPVKYLMRNHELFEKSTLFHPITHCDRLSRMIFPQTSRRLLAAIGSMPYDARWTEFVTLYTPALRDYAERHFPQLDADDLLQETFIALLKRLPVYYYAPESKGAFHAYLVGILRYAALDALRKTTRENDRIAVFRETAHAAPTCHDEERRSLKEAAYEIALRQFLADPKVHAQTKEVFTRVAINGEKPEEVASSFGMKRNAIDQLKDRCIRRLKELVNQLVEGLHQQSAET